MKFEKGRPITQLAMLMALAGAPAAAQATNPCEGRQNDGPAIQAALDLGSPVNLEPRLHCVDARVGVRFQSNRQLRMNGATVGILPGCTTNCKAFETVPGSSSVSLVGPGTVVGDLTTAVGFSIGFRADSVTDLEIDGVTFRDWRTDAIWQGGNQGTHSSRIYRVAIDGFVRNGISIVNGSDFVVDSVHCKRSLGNNPAACIDAEANPPDDQVVGLTIINSLFEDARIGLYLHSGKGRQQQNVRVLNNTIRGCYLYGIILNSTRHAFLIDNVILAPARVPGQPEPTGISMGVTMPTPGSYSTLPIYAEDVTVAGNRVEGTARSAILAGALNVKVTSNAWVGGSLLTVAPAPGVPAVGGVQVYIP